MASTNKYGQKISYDCSELIEELKEDIDEFGGHNIVNVITEEKHGVTIYKDYFMGDDVSDIVLKDTEKMEKLTMTALLTVYEEENSIL